MYRLFRWFNRWNFSGIGARIRSTATARIASTSIITVIARCITMPWWLWLSPCDTCIVNTRLAALYDRRRCKVKCAWLRSTLVYGIRASISMFRSYSKGVPTNETFVRSNSVAGQLPRKCMDKDGWVQSHPRSCKLKNTAPSLLSRWCVYF